MSELYLSERPSWTREQMIRRLQDRLAESGVRFHERSLRRHLGGAVLSVPPELESTLTALLREDTRFTTPELLAAALEARGLASTRPDPDYVPSETAVTLTRLWLYLHPKTSKRALSTRISAELAARGVSVGLDALQSELAGRGQLVRREVVEIILRHLEEDGLVGEAAALDKARELASEIHAFERRRALVDGAQFRELAAVWQLRNKQASTRRLAAVLREHLRGRGLRVGIDHLQRLISGKANQVRVEVMEALEDLVQLRPGELEALRGELGSEKAHDLQWVDAQPIHALAEQWLRAHPEVTTRQLAHRVAASVREMGYSTSHNTIQPILGGWKKRTRGFVHRAMQAQFDEAAPAPQAAEGARVVSLRESPPVELSDSAELRRVAFQRR